MRQWTWIMAGLTAWAALVILWATGPSHCTAPNQDGKVVCQR